MVTDIRGVSSAGRDEDREEDVDDGDEEDGQQDEVAVRVGHTLVALHVDVVTAVEDEQNAHQHLQSDRAGDAHQVDDEVKVERHQPLRSAGHRTTRRCVGAAARPHRRRSMSHGQSVGIALIMKQQIL